MYRELGGRDSYMRTPLRELQEIRVSIIGELNVQHEEHEEMKRKQKEQERKMEQQQARYRSG